MKFPILRFASVAILVATASATAPQVQAQGFFEALFGGRVKRERSFPPPPRAQAAPKIQAPSYATYRADALIRVDFASMIGPPRSVVFEPGVKSGFADLAGSLEGFELFAEKPVAAALIGHYTANPAFVWIVDRAPSEKALQVLRVLGNAADEGLDPADYRVDTPLPGGAATDYALMQFEVTLSARVLRYLRDARNGRIEPNRMSGYYDFPAMPLDLAAALQDLSLQGDLAAYLARQHPQNAQYRSLRAELAALKLAKDDTIAVDETLLLKPGEASPELPKLLALIARDLDDELGGDYGDILYRFGLSQTYARELVPLIKEMQKRAGLKPDGVIGPRTVKALAGVSRSDKINKLVVAMEQMRWLPAELGPTRVFINQPAFTASYVENDAEKLSMRAVVGKVTNQTSFFYDEIEQVDYNPYWGVPQSIIVNEMLPRLRRDPGYLDRAGYEVFSARGQRVPSASVDWGAYGAKIPYAVRQIPSEANALGELKILFPNKHSIYMHDTPQKALFQRDNRALSHGCVRLADPRGMAAAVLGKSREHIAQKLKRGHSSEKVARKIPVYVAYFTAWPNAAGQVEYFGDVYGRDARLLEAMDKTGAVRAPTS